jgi:hypothetical protein
MLGNRNNEQGRKKEMYVSDRIGGEGIGIGSNNVMSLWTFPWARGRRLIRRPRQQQQQQYLPNNMMKYSLLAVVLVLCLAFRDDYDIAPGHLLDIEMAKTQTADNGSQGADISLAVLVAGSTQRFLFDSFVQHVAGASTSGSKTLAVDYFTILTLKSGPAFRQDDGYMGHLAGRDKLFDGILATNDPKKSPEATQKQMMETMTSAVAASSSTTTKTNIRALRLLEEPIEDDPVLDAVRSREQKRFEGDAQSSKATSFDLFQQFPMMDKRQKALTRTQAGNKNMIRLFLALESLWKTEFLSFEKTKKQQQDDQAYDYVLILRDDTLWLDDFDLQKVIDTDPTADAYILSCDGREPKMLPPEINDHGILIRREKAGIVGEYVSAMASLDLKRCHESVTEWLGKERGCNSEMILKHILETNGVRVKLVPQSLLPFERAVLIDGKTRKTGNGGDYHCYHKFCQSIDLPLELPSGIQRCKELTFDSR